MHSLLRTSSVAVLALALAACNTTDATKPLSGQALLVAADIMADQGVAASNSVQNVLGAESLTASSSFLMAPASLQIASGTMLDGFPGGPGLPHGGERVCAPMAVDGWIGCTGGREFGLQVTRQHRFFAGTAFLPTWGVTADSAQYRWSVVGVDSIRREDRGHDDDHDDAVNHTRWVNEGDTATMVPVRTVGNEQRIWNFHGSMDDSSLVVGPKGTRRYHVVASRVGKDITWKLPRNLNPWPMSGTLTSNFATTVIFVDTLGKADTVSRSGTVTVTFDGNKPDVGIAGMGLRCLLHLNLRRLSKCG